MLFVFLLPLMLVNKDYHYLRQHTVAYISASRWLFTDWN